jgi:multiple sugar transport system substrate-binding protein
MAPVLLTVILVLAPPLALSSASAAPDEGGPITLVTGLDDSSDGVLGKLLDEWDHLHPVNQVRVVELPNNANLEHAQLLAAEQTADANYDVLNLDVTWTAEFAADGAIQQLDRSVLRPNGALPDFVAKSLESAELGTNGNQLWAVPYTADVGLLYYRADLLRSANLPPPKTWTDMQKDFAGVHNMQIHQPPYRSELSAAYTSQLRDYEGLTVNAVEAAAAEGEDLTKLSGPSMGLTALAQNMMSGLILRDSTTYDETASREAFRDGRVLFMRNWPTAYNLLAADPALPANAVGITQLPSLSAGHTARGVLGGGNLAVAAHSTKPKLATELIEFLTSPASERCLLDQGGLAATRLGAYQPVDQATPACPLPVPATGSAGAGQTEGSHTAATLFSTPGALATLRAALKTATLRPTTPYYSQVTDVISGRVADMLNAAIERKSFDGTNAGLPDALKKALSGD